MFKFRKFALILTVAAAAGLAAGLFAADSTQPSMQKGAADAKAAMQPPMSEKEMMEQYEKASALNDHHKHIQKMVGTWSAVVKWWPAPGAPASESKGTAKFTSILGGHFVQMDYQGDMMGQPFQGSGTFGYDNGRKKHVSTWIDSMGTGIMVSLGDGDGKTFTSTSEYDDPMTGKPTKSRMVTKVLGPDKHTFEMYGPGPDGKERLVMEITYDRAK
jgi:hypothetical protein